MKKIILVLVMALFSMPLYGTENLADFAFTDNNAVQSADSTSTDAELVELRRKALQLSLAIMCQFRDALSYILQDGLELEKSYKGPYEYWPGERDAIRALLRGNVSSYWVARWLAWLKAN
jgi:hypothetical protein